MFGSDAVAMADTISNDPVDPMPAMVTTEWFDELTDEVIDILIGAAGPATPGRPPLLTFTEIRHAGGAVRELSAGAANRRRTPGRVPDRDRRGWSRSPSSRRPSPTCSAGPGPPWRPTSPARRTSTSPRATRSRSARPPPSAPRSGRASPPSSAPSTPRTASTTASSSPADSGRLAPRPTTRIRAPWFPGAGNEGARFGSARSIARTLGR